MRKLVSTLAALMFLLSVSTSLAAEIWQLPKNGIYIEGAAKQDYIKSRMEEIYNKKPGTPHPFSKFEVPDGWIYKKFEVDGSKFETLENPAAKTERVILHLHGGGYVLPLDDGHRNLSLVQADLIGAAKIFLSDYRIAPQNIFPDALEDAVKTYKEMLNRGIKPENIIVTGDSAGGNLALALSLYLKENKIEQPNCLILISPWTTAENKLPSRRYNENRDLILGKGTPLYETVKNPAYAKSFNKKNPQLSPIYADLRNLPPMLVQVGGYELFLDECLELAKKAAADNVKLTLTVYPEMSHDFVLLLPELQESITSFREIQAFVDENSWSDKLVIK